MMETINEIDQKTNTAETRSNLLAPKLRFKEFDLEWVNSKIGDNCKVLMCKRIFADQTSVSEEIPFYKIGTIGGEPDAFISKALFEEFRNKYNYPRKGEVLITCSGTVGKCIPFNGIDAYYQDSNIVWIDNPTLKIRNEYLFYILSNYDWSKLNSTTISRIYGSDLRNLIVKHPKTEKEQQKITSFLSAVDEKIQQLSRKKELLEQYKKGVMQNLFSGKLRFKDENGGDFPDWEEKRLGKIGTVIRGASPRPQGDKRYYGGNVPRLMVKDVTRDGKFVTPVTDYLTEEGAKLSRPCKAGTLTIVCSGTVGIPSFLAVDACIHDGFLALIEIDTKYDQDYIYHNLTTLRDKFESSATHGGVFTNLTTNAIKEFKVTFPCFPEQQKIASYLSSIDTKIESVSNQITQTQTYKKGLLQQMFV